LLLTRAGFRDNIFVHVNMKRRLTATHTLFRAFADETRLRLLNLLLEGERCVCELCDILKVSQPNVSRHLGYLRRAGLVTMRQQGKWKYYAVAKNTVGVHRALLNCVRDCLRGVDVLKKDLRQLRKITLRCGC
jgi:ArsR family transcriptional regulator, arsenate/arsenite/antimonite-responsive transcriptional repressor